MPSFDEELASLGSGTSGGKPSFDDELNALSAPEPSREQESLGSSPSGIQFSAAPSDVAAWNAGKSDVPAQPDMDFSDSPMAVPQTGGIDGLYDRLFKGNAQRDYDRMVGGVANSGVKYETPSIAETYTGAVMGPVVGGVASGALRGARESQAGDFRGRALDAAEGGLYGGLAGGASKVLGAGSKYFGDAAEWAGGKLRGLSESPAVKDAARMWGAGLGGSAGGAVGSAIPIPGAGYAGAGLGSIAGAAAGGKAVPATLRGAGNMSSAVGKGAGLFQNPAMQALETMGVNRSVSSNLDREQTIEGASDAGRGNLLGDAALEVLQTNPRLLGEYQGEFARAAASSEVGAVNNLIVKLAQKDPKFRAGPMVELQKMTAEY